MNCLTVIQTSQGLAQYVKDQRNDPGNESVVIGYDVRHNSKKFAELAATAFLKKGFTVLFYHDYVHTPLVPFAVKLRGAAVGVMITASHNPACDNGYKVYWGPSGCQINSPHDVGITRRILDRDSLQPMSWNTTALHENPRFQFITSEILMNYYEAVSRLGNRPREIHRHYPFVYTPLHGTGRIYMEELCKKLGFAKDMVLVETQVRSAVRSARTVRDSMLILCRQRRILAFRRSNIRTQRRLVLLIWRTPQPIKIISTSSWPTTLTLIVSPLRRKSSKSSFSV